MGICLGLQLLFETSDEMGEYEGLGLFPGRVTRFPPSELVVPHMGWNQLWPQGDAEILAGVTPGSYAYFVHSYYAEPADPDIIYATTDYGIDFASVVGQDNVLGLQFHPEKSQHVGLTILRNFVRMLNKDGAEGA
jgi:glutamine amidotransferase